MLNSMKKRCRTQQIVAEDQQWRAILQNALEDLVGTPSTKSLARPSVRLLSINRAGNRIALELRFESRRHYCCAEPGCHLPTHDHGWWKSLRKHLANYSDRNPPPMILKIRGAVEAGARLQCNASLGIPALSPAYTFVQAPIRERRTPRVNKLKNRRS